MEIPTMETWTMTDDSKHTCVELMVVEKVLDRQDTLMKAYGEMCTALGEIKAQLGGIEKNTKGTEEALRNAIVQRISICVDSSVDKLYWRFSGTIILIFGIFSVIVKVL